jgi:cation diffusion facilitator CzcD-associated flavoprotein CzcO
MNGHANGSAGSPATDFDVIIVGAGISGINAGYRVQDQLPGFSYSILEARDDLGGTWDLFKYPGIRSDSDLFTFGFAFNPWNRSNPIAEGSAIKSYVRDTAEKFGIAKNIRFRNRLNSADWSSTENVWSLNVDADGTPTTLRARFVIFGTGYYNYHQPLKANIPNLDDFQGQIIHPQVWPENLDYAGKKVVIIGSGATAITLLPNLAEKAERVTMLQRSPTYILSLPNRSNSRWLAYLLPSSLYHRLQRFIWIYTSRIFFLFCQRFPGFSRWILRQNVSRQLPSHISHDPHFKPRYNPWDQRLCVCPDGDFFQSLRRGKADVRTDTIKTVTKRGITLNSGESLDADIIVTATGLQLQIAGGSNLTVDGKKIEIGSKFLWNGVMLQDLPNASFIIGYTNASWTLGADATVQFITRLLRTMKERKLVSATPRMRANEEKTLEERPLLNLNSTYVTVASKHLPMAGDKGPWQARDHYHKDIKFATNGDLETGMDYVKGNVQLRPKQA